MINEIRVDKQVAALVGAARERILTEDDEFIMLIKSNEKIKLTGYINHKFSLERTLLHMAVTSCNAMLVKEILNTNIFNLNAKDVDGKTALMYCCIVSPEKELDMMNLSEIFLSLLNAHFYQKRLFRRVKIKTYKNIIDDYGSTAFHYALYSKNIVFANILLAHGAKCSSQRERENIIIPLSVLHMIGSITTKKHSEFVKFLLNGASFHQEMERLCVKVLSKKTPTYRVYYNASVLYTTVLNRNLILFKILLRIIDTFFLTGKKIKFYWSNLKLMETGMSPLIATCEDKSGVVGQDEELDVWFAEHMVNAGADVNGGEEFLFIPSCPLLEALENMNVQMDQPLTNDLAWFFLNNNASVEYFWYDITTSRTHTVLDAGLRSGDPDIVAAIIRALGGLKDDLKKEILPGFLIGLFFDDMDIGNKEWTEKQIEIVRVLIEAGAQIEYFAQDSAYSASWLAYSFTFHLNSENTFRYRSILQLCQAFIAEGADIDHVKGNSPNILMTALYKNSFFGTKLLITKNANLDFSYTVGACSHLYGIHRTQHFTTARDLLLFFSPLSDPTTSTLVCDVCLQHIPITGLSTKLCEVTTCDVHVCERCFQFVQDPEDEKNHPLTSLAKRVCDPNIINLVNFSLTSVSRTLVSEDAGYSDYIEHFQNAKIDVSVLAKKLTPEHLTKMGISKNETLLLKWLSKC